MNLRAQTARGLMNGSDEGDDGMLFRTVSLKSSVKAGPTALELACSFAAHPIVVETLLRGGAHPTNAAQQAALSVQTRMSNDDDGGSENGMDIGGGDFVVGDVDGSENDGSDDGGEAGSAESHADLCQRTIDLLHDADSARSLAGQRVRLEGLDKLELNGRLGRVVKRWPGFQRRAVWLDGAPSGLSLKEGNLKYLDEDDEDDEESDDEEGEFGEADGVVATTRVAADESSLFDGKQEERGGVGYLSRIFSGLTSSGGDGEAGGCDGLRIAPSNLNDVLGDDERFLADLDGSGTSSSGRGKPRKSKRIFLAASRGDAAQLATLLRAGTSPDATDADGSTLLRKAIGVGSAGDECVKVLLDAKADPNRPGDRSSNELPVGIAALMGLHEQVALLLDAGAWPGGRAPDSQATNASNKIGDNPILMVARLACMLIGKDCDDVDPGVLRGLQLRDGNRPDDLVASRLKCFSLLLAKTEDSVLKLTCLNEAARHSNAAGVRIIQLLIDDGVDPDEGIVQQVGHNSLRTYTALLHACDAKAVKCVEALLAAGANPSGSLTAHGVNGVVVTSPMSIAKETKDRATMALLIGALQQGQKLVGAMVRVEGYRRAKPALNGTRGEVLGFDPKTGQCKVHLDVGNGSTRSHELPPSVLMVIERDEGDAEDDGQQPSPSNSNARSDDDPVDMNADNAYALCQSVSNDPLFHAAARIAAMRYYSNWEFNHCEEGKERSRNALRAAVERLQSNGHLMDDIFVFALVVAAGADLSKEAALEDGWNVWDVATEDAELLRLLTMMERPLEADVEVERVIESAAEQEDLRPLWHVCSLDSQLSSASRALLFYMYASHTMEAHQLVALAGLLARTDPNVVVQMASAQLSPLLLAYEAEHEQPSLTLLLLLAAGADCSYELDRGADEDWQDERWTLLKAAKRCNDTETLRLIASLVDERNIMEEMLASELRRDVQDADGAALLILRYADKLSQSSNHIKEFMIDLPRSVRLRPVVSALCQSLEREGDADSLAHTDEAVRDGLLGHFLLYAASRDDDVAVEALLTARADPAFQGFDDGLAALMYAVCNGNKKMVETLIRAGSPYAHIQPEHAPYLTLSLSRACL